MMSRINAISKALLLSLVVLFIFSGNVYAKKEIMTFICTSPPGGGFDTYSRALARFMPKYLPGNPDFIVKNIPGGGNRLGTNMLYRSKPDGKTIGMLNMPGIQVTQLIMETQYDVTKMSWIGNVYIDPYGFAVAANSKFKTIKDFQESKTKVRIGTTGKGSTSQLVTVVVCETLKIPYQIVPYDGSSPAMLDLIRGNLDCFFFSETPLAPYRQKGDVKVLAVLRPQRGEVLPDVPTFKELGYDPDGTLSTIASYRMVAGPPGLPKDKIAVLEEALKKTVADKEMQEWSKKSNYPVEFQSGKECEEIIKGFVNLFTNNKAILEKSY